MRPNLETAVPVPLFRCQSNTGWLHRLTHKGIVRGFFCSVWSTSRRRVEHGQPGSPGPTCIIWPTTPLRTSSFLTPLRRRNGPLTPDNSTDGVRSTPRAGDLGTFVQKRILLGPRRSPCRDFCEGFARVQALPSAWTWTLARP
jgi:hypothetical protein